MNNKLNFYNYKSEISLLCGVDEAGRGPLAGDVFVAAVILPKDLIIDGLRDSKKLSGKKREQLFNFIVKNAISYSIQSSTIYEIEKYNILAATHMAMNRAIDNVKAEYALIDGNIMRDCKIPYETIIKGDNKIACIAAASILAKVSRDRYMIEQAKLYPQYFFEKHKGYGTVLHREMILKHGVCALHRPSFLRKILASPKKNNITPRDIGNLGEDLAIKYLLERDFEILKRNFYSKYGEIDIIAIKKDIIHFIEVKTRKNDKFMAACESVSYSKQQKIIKTALIYNPDCYCCFDVIEIYGCGDINFIENAFS